MQSRNDATIEGPMRAQRGASFARRFPLGAELAAPHGAHFRVWAPASNTAAITEVSAQDVVTRTTALQSEPGGYFSGFVDGVVAGTRYRIKLDSGAFPDPASRFQPEGPHGFSQVIDPSFPWTDCAWQVRQMNELVIYELHLGTFSSAGTWRGAMEKLPLLAQLGITMIEVMPIADFPGRFGWGYDGVDLFAPCRLYGTPDDARAFVNRAHELGVAVILDVVYNHLGPDGNFLREFSPHYFSKRYANEWGDPLNFDGEHSTPVREFFVTNASYWITEFHFDGLRLDATQQMFDASSTHVIADISRAAREAGGARRICLVGENEPQHAELARPRDAGGGGLDALWNDDFHHSAHVAATGRSEAYYTDYRGAPQEFVSGAKYGFLFQGQWYRWQKKTRGRPAFDLRSTSFVTFLENHDQVANSLRGHRLHQMTSPGLMRALTALLLLSPQIPLLFQGQEFAASTAFLYFADHKPELARRVREGREEFLRQFPSVAAAGSAHQPQDPAAREAFERSKVDWTEQTKHAAAYRLHADLLRLRREEPVVRDALRVDGAVLGASAFVLRYFARDGQDRILLVNLGVDLWLSPAPEPLLAPPREAGWTIVWSSETPDYGGGGTAKLELDASWTLPGQSAVWLA